MSSQLLDHGETGNAPMVTEEPFDLRCEWRRHEGHPHLSVGYVVVDGETLWGVYVCSATYLVPGNEWSFTLPMTYAIHEVTMIALNAIAWDRFAVVESERPGYDDPVKGYIMNSLRTIATFSRPSRLVDAIREFLGP